MNTSKSNYQEEKEINLWRKIERIILVITFFATVGVSTYSILTASKALKLSSNELRPWISIPKVETYFHGDLLRTKFQIINIGKLPAYLTIDGFVEVNGTVYNPEDIYIKPIVCMPGQIIKYSAFVMRGDSYKELIKGETLPQVYQSILVKYGLKKDDLEKYFTSHKVKFRPEKITRPIKPGFAQDAGLWTFEESDFR